MIFINSAGSELFGLSFVLFFLGRYKNRYEINETDVYTRVFKRERGNIRRERKRERKIAGQEGKFLRRSFNLNPEIGKLLDLSVNL